jgi:hypothetical protein
MNQTTKIPAPIEGNQGKSRKVVTDKWRSYEIAHRERHSTINLTKLWVNYKELAIHGC